MTRRGTTPPPPRTAFVRSVRANLRLDPDTELEVIDELEDHLDDSIRALAETGLRPSEAEPEALRRLGDPAELGRSLRRAHQRHRRLLAAAGGGILGAADGVTRQVVPLIAIQTVAMFAFLGIAWAWDKVTGVQVSAFAAQGALGAPAAVLFAFGGARRMAWAVARGAQRPLAVAAAATAVVGAAVIAAWTLIGPPMTVDEATIWTALAAIASWVAGAVSVRFLSDILLTRRRWLAGGLVVGAIVFAQVLVGGGTDDPSGPFSANLARAGRPVPEAIVVFNAGQREGSLPDRGVLSVIETTTEDDPESAAFLARARDPRLELWAASRTVGSMPQSLFAVGDLDPRAAGPVRSVPLARAGGRLVGSIRFDDIRGLGAAWILSTATVDGHRVILGSEPVVPAFHGNLLAWLVQPADPLQAAAR